MGDFENMLNDLCKMSKAQLVQMVKNTDEVEIALNIFKNVMKKDYVRVLRCKDCINYIGGTCWRCGLDYSVIVDADDFCSRGVTE